MNRGTWKKRKYIATCHAYTGDVFHIHYESRHRAGSRPNADDCHKAYYRFPFSNEHPHLKIMNVQLKKEV